jgi:hypothetical protein
LLAASILETHSTIPAGVYLCAYWIMYNVIITVRPTLSWRHRMPWLATLALSELWIIIFENFVAFFIDGIAGFSLHHAINLVVRLACAVGVGQLIWIYRRQWDEGEVLAK